MGAFLKKLKHAFAVGPEPSVLAGELPPVLERLAVDIVERQMETPATVLLDSIRPISFLAGQAMHAVWPLVKMTGKFDDYQIVAEALEDRQMVELFIARIESLAEARPTQGDTP
jgi:hypothetical protein